LGDVDDVRYTRIFPKGKRPLSYDPLRTRHALYGEFAKIKTQAELLKFVNRHGPLTKDGNDVQRGETVEFALSQAAEIRRLLASYSEEPEPRGATVPFLARIDTSLTFDAFTARPKITAVPRNLLEALWFQCAQAIVGGTVVRYCLECGKQFKAGLGRGKGPRRDAKFCSSEHQIAFNNRNRRREA
jgi:hypothetical protein